MKIKPGASIEGLDIRMRPALMVAGKIWKDHGQELVITRGLEDYRNSQEDGSFHPYGLAVDLRTRYFRGQEEKSNVFRELRSAALKADPNYDVVLETNHIHVEYDE